MPTAVARPWPSGPVVVSTPGVWPYSGWPAVIEPSWRKRLICSMRHRFVAGEIEQRIEQHRAVAGRQHEAVAVGPVGAAGSNFRNCVNSTVATSAAPMGRPGWPDFACSTASIASARMALARSVGAGDALTAPWRSSCATAAVDEAGAFMEKAYLRGVDSMWPLRVNVTAQAPGSHAQAGENFGVNRAASVDGRIAQHVRFFT